MERPGRHATSRVWEQLPRDFALRRAIKMHLGVKKDGTALSAFLRWGVLFLFKEVSI
jgi:hypothetical protein